MRDIIRRIVGNASRKDMEYRCWMCGMGHKNPSAFLWHINACEMERTGNVVAPNNDRASVYIVTMNTKKIR